MYTYMHTYTSCTPLILFMLKTTSNEYDYSFRYL